MSPLILSPAVQYAIASLIAEISDTYSLHDLINYVQGWRTKMLRIEEDWMPSGMTGYAVTLADCDLICLCPKLDALLRRRTLLHELSHFILNHIEAHPTDRVLPLYSVFIQRRNRHEFAAHRLYRHRFYSTMYDTPQEMDAEVLALLLNKGIRSDERRAPLIARLLHG